MHGYLYFWFIMIIVIVILLIIRLYTRPKFSEYFNIDNTDFKIINIADYEGDWNILANIVVKYCEKYDHIIVHSDFENLTILANALTFMIENLTKPVIITNNSENVTKIIKNNKLLPLNVMVEHKNNLYTSVSSYKDGNDIFGIPVKFKRTEHNLSPVIKNVNPNINIKIIDSNPNLDIVNSCAGGDAIILNLNDSNHFDSISMNNLLQQPIPSIIINNTNGNIDIPSFNITSEAAYAKLAVIMSNIDDLQLTEPVFAKNLKNEFI